MRASYQECHFSFNCYPWICIEIIESEAVFNSSSVPAFSLDTSALSKDFHGVFSEKSAKVFHSRLKYVPSISTCHLVFLVNLFQSSRLLCSCYCWQFTTSSSSTSSFSCFTSYLSPTRSYELGQFQDFCEFHLNSYNWKSRSGKIGLG